MKIVFIITGVIFTSLIGDYSVYSEELCYYEGPLRSVLVTDSGNGFAIQFTPPSLPIQLDSVSFYIISEGESLLPMPDSIHQPFQVSIFGDGGGVPGAEIFVDTVQADSFTPRWVKSYPSLTLTSGDFWVAYFQITPYPFSEGLGMDSLMDHSSRNWMRVNGDWLVVIPFSGDAMICAYVSGYPGVEEDEGFVISENFFLSEVFPNPSQGGVWIQYGLTTPSSMSLSLYDLSGRLIRILVNRKVEEGMREMFWDGRDQFGNPVPGGLYVLRLESGDFASTRKLVRLR